MSGLPLRRKRDVWKDKLRLGRSASPSIAQNPNSGSSNTPSALLPVPSLSSNQSPSLSSAQHPSATIVTAASGLPSSQAAQAVNSSSFIPNTPVPDLWYKALQTLTEGDQQAIQSIPLKPVVGPWSENMKELVDLTKAKQQDCEEGFYQFSFQGKTLILRDVAEKVVFWLNKFKAFGDIAVNFDPGHASLPWAGVRFLLQTAVAGYEQMGALLVSIEFVSSMMNRCRVYESLYRTGTLSGQVLDNLDAALTQLYAAILRLIALAHRLLAKNSKTRALHAVFNPDEMLTLLSKCQDLGSEVEIEAQNCERVRSKQGDSIAQELLECLRKPILRTDERVASFLERVDERERLEILEWISGALYGKAHANVKEQRTEHTCEWILKHNNYREWQDSSSSLILWLHGIPGAGKTYLTSKVIDEVQNGLKSSLNDEGLAFFYCNQNETGRQEPLSVLRSFVRQLSTISRDEQCVQKRLRQYFLETRQKGSEPTTGDCKTLLLELLNLYPKTTLILDALDECDKHTRGQLIKFFEDVVDKATKPVKIFISSRPDDDIRESFDGRISIAIQATDNHGDISKFVKSEITKHRRWNKISLELRDEIIQTLQDRSQGMFQWAYLQIKQLLDLNQETHIRDRLGKLPKNLKSAYDEIYAQISKFEKPYADRAFQWVMRSHEPIRREELLVAVCQDMESDTILPVKDLDEDLLLEYCHNLLVIDSVRGVWIPSHLSVTEYFEAHLWSHKQAHCVIASVCLLLLNDITYDNLEIIWAEINDKNYKYSETRDPFFHGLGKYAAKHWALHVQKCEGESTKSRLSTLLKRFLGSPQLSSPAYQGWSKAMNIIYKDYSLRHDYGLTRNSRFVPEDLEPASSASFAICAFGFTSLVSDWWDCPWTECIQVKMQGNSLLTLGSLAGSVSICTQLLAWGVEVNKQILAANCGSALVAAASKGSESVVRLLLDSGAEINMQVQKGHFGTALVAAALGARKDIVELLLDSGADVNARLQFGQYRTALEAAPKGRNEEVAQLLIEHGAVGEAPQTP